MADRQAEIVKRLKSTDGVLIAFAVSKLMRVGISYASLLIARNYTSQIYMDKVLVNDENPPHLSNLIYLYMIIEFVMITVMILLLYSLDATFDLGFVNSRFNLFTQFIITDYLVASILNISVGSVVANKMYEKKYFLYKDDGMRAIRALTEIMIAVAIINNIMPYNFIFGGIVSLIGNE